ncbi:hypothetical protein Emed_007448 [Eimeria media]
METDEEVCESPKEEQTLLLRRPNSAGEEAWQEDALFAMAGSAVNVAEPNKGAHVSFKLGESQAHLSLEGPGNTHFGDNNNANATNGLTSKWNLPDSPIGVVTTGDIPTFERPIEVADDAELATVAPWEIRGGGEPTGAALQHGAQKNQQEAGEEPLTPTHQRRGLQEAMTMLSTATHNLEGKLDLLLAQHEEDFLTAFRSHMAEVQKHVECLRDCADAQKNLMMRDLKIKTLQKELKWFLEEAARLDQVVQRNVL